MTANLHQFYLTPFYKYCRQLATEQIDLLFGLFLTLLTFVLFITKTAFLWPLSMMCISGVLLTLTKRIYTSDNRALFLSLLFILLWLPMVLSSIDAVNSSRTIVKTFVYLLFLPSGFFILHSFNSTKAPQILHTSIFILLCAWILDAVLQFFHGQNLFGYPYTPPQLMGMFYPKARISFFLAVLAPLFFEYLRLNFTNQKLLLLLLVLFGMVVLLGGKRSSWIMLIFSSISYLLYLYLLQKRPSLKKAGLTAVAIALPLLILSLIHIPLKQRIASTLGIFSTEPHMINKASANRLDLWRAASAMARDNWLNGVGPRGFREVFSQYAEKDNIWIQAGHYTGSTHPHLQILEIACETGLIGLTGYILFYLLLLRLLLFEIRAGRLASVPWLLCPLTAYFPLNAHLAFYGSYWSSVSWWMLSVSLAVVFTKRNGKNITP